MSERFVVRPRAGAAPIRREPPVRGGAPIRRQAADSPVASDSGAATPAAALTLFGDHRAAAGEGRAWTPDRRSGDAGTREPSSAVSSVRPARAESAGGTASVGRIASDPRSERERLTQHPVLAPLCAYLEQGDVTDLFINGAAGLFVDRGSGPVRAREWRATEDEVRELAVALIGLGGRHIDDASPCVDVRLDGGVRIHAVLPPVAAEGTAISIRVPRLADPGLDALQATGMFDATARQMLDEAIGRRANLLVSGAAGAGKTTLLAAMLGEAPDHERIITIEDVAELRLDHPHHVRLEARQPNLEGAGGVGLARLVREALRMRPDRLIVGECRGDEVRELLSALNTGHDGGAGTVHANGLHDVPARLEALGALAGLDDLSLARQVASAIDLVLHVERGTDGMRRLAGAGRPVIDPSGRLAIEEVPCGSD
jgi:pilus assembly protein CpaF